MSNCKLNETLHIIASALQAQCGLDRMGTPPKDGCFPYVPIGADVFCEIASTLKALNPEGKKFLDVGSGPGLTLVMAIACGWRDVTGLDLAKKNVQVGNIFLERAKQNRSASYWCVEGAKVLCEDILEFNDYADFDAIYWFNPISDYKLRRELHDRITDQAKPGALLVPHCCDFYLSSDSRVEIAFSSSVWGTRAFKIYRKI